MSASRRDTSGTTQSPPAVSERRVYGSVGGALHRMLGDAQGRARQIVVELQVGDVDMRVRLSHEKTIHRQAQVTLQSAHIWRKVPTNERT
jgi:hypothetical protein